MTVVITNIENEDELLHYAARAQLERVKSATGYNVQQVASNLKKYREQSNFLTHLKSPGDDLLEDLDGKLMSLMPELDTTGGLSALAVRLRRGSLESALTARVPPARRRQALSRRTVDEYDVLSKASALLAKLRAVPDNAQQVCDRHERDLSEVVRQLILIGAAPPTPDNVEALILLGSIAGIGAAFDAVELILEEALASHPLGFRMWRSVTTIVRLNEHSAAATESILPWVKTQIEMIDDIRRNSLFPARSLDLESAVAIPLAWSPPGRKDWVGDVLKHRATDNTATVRERGTAAHGLWERAMKSKDPDHIAETEVFLRTLVGQMREESESGDVAVGLRWVAASVEHNLDSGQSICNTWPTTDHACLRVVRDAVASELSSPAVPAIILDATKTLVEHAVLQNSGVHRRHAIDTLLAAGSIRPVIRTFGAILDHPDAEEWFKCRVLFAISFLQNRDRGTADLLSDAFIDADLRLRRRIDTAGSTVPRGVASELHAALFAIGDLFGVFTAKAAAVRLRHKLNPKLKALLHLSSADPSLHRVGRAAAYVVAMTAQTGDNSRSMLESIDSAHPDEATKNLRDWALSKLIDKNGAVKRLYEAI